MSMCYSFANVKTSNKWNCCKYYQLISRYIFLRFTLLSFWKVLNWNFERILNRKSCGLWVNLEYEKNTV